MITKDVLLLALVDGLPDDREAKHDKPIKRREASPMTDSSAAKVNQSASSSSDESVAPQITDPAEIDPAAWLDEHGDYLFRYAFMRVNSQETAEDLVQEALLAAVKGHKNFEGRSTVRTWLVGILKNKIIDYLRRSSRKEKREVLEEDNETLDRHFNKFGIWNRVLPNWAAEPGEIVERKEFMRAFEGCLRKVPEKSRRAFMLKTFENIETDEVCNILDVSPSNLWVLLHRCRLNLRECLEKNWAGIPDGLKES